MVHICLYLVFHLSREFSLIRRRCLCRWRARSVSISVCVPPTRGIRVFLGSSPRTRIFHTCRRAFGIVELSLPVLITQVCRDRHSNTQPFPCFTAAHPTFVHCTEGLGLILLWLNTKYGQTSRFYPQNSEIKTRWIFPIYSILNEYAYVCKVSKFKFLLHRPQHEDDWLKLKFTACFNLVEQCFKFEIP